MSDNTPRPRPIVVTQAVMASLGAVIGAAGFADQIPAAAAWWIITGYAAINIGLAFYLQSITTPLSSPRAADGRDLVPAGTTTVVASGGTTTVTAPEGTGPEVTATADGARLTWTQPSPHAPVEPRPDL